MRALPVAVNNPKWKLAELANREEGHRVRTIATNGDIHPLIRGNRGRAPSATPPRYLICITPGVERSLIINTLHGVLLHGKGAEMGLAHNAGAGLLQSEDHVCGCVLLGIHLEKRPVADGGLGPADVEVVFDCDSKSAKQAAASLGGFCERVWLRRDGNTVASVPVSSNVYWDQFSKWGFDWLVKVDKSTSLLSFDCYCLPGDAPTTATEPAKMTTGSLRRPSRLNVTRSC